MTHDKDKILLRAKDLSLLILVLTFFGLIAGPLKKIFTIDDIISKVAKMDDRVSAHETSIAVINSQYQEIQEQLKQINWQLRSINRNTR